jgi:hypothetical protein
MAQNTLNLTGDGDDQDVLDDTRRTFGIQFSDEETENTLTVGQFYDLIVGKYRLSHPQTDACFSQLAFYRLRRTFREMGLEGPFTPNTLLHGVVSVVSEKRGTRHFWGELGRRSGLRLPDRELNGFRGSFLLSFLGLTGLFASAIHQTGVEVASAVLLGFMTAIPAVTLGYALLRYGFGAIPSRLTTVGDLAREAAGHSFAELHSQKPGAGPTDLWYALTAILREITCHKAVIDRETTFFAKPVSPQARSCRPS